jgi:hypothetical protein
MECRVAVYSDPGGSSTAGQNTPKRSGAWRRPDPKGNAQIILISRTTIIYWAHIPIKTYFYSYEYQPGTETLLFTELYVP